jgi:hypothetical protein
MQNFMKRVKVAAVGGVIVFASVGIGTAAAADVPVPEAELEAPSPENNRPHRDITVKNRASPICLLQGSTAIHRLDPGPTTHMTRHRS